MVLFSFVIIFVVAVVPVVSGVLKMINYYWTVGPDTDCHTAFVFIGSALYRSNEL